MTPTEVEVPETKPAAAQKPKATDKGEEKTTEKKADKKEYTALPDGFVAPVAFAKLLTAKLHEEKLLPEDEEVRPQVVYGYVKNGSEFPVKPSPEGARSGHMVNVAEGLEWCITRRKKTAESKAKKAAEAAATETEGDSE
jgi:hypothetical protein